MGADLSRDQLSLLLLDQLGEAEHTIAWLFGAPYRHDQANTYEVGATGSEWAAKLYLTQPVRHGTGGIWVITRTGSPAGSY
jgi:hypothetical protein